MKMYRIVSYVFDFEDRGIDNTLQEIENMRYVTLRTGSVQTTDVGEWDDDHILNSVASTNETFEDFFK